MIKAVIIDDENKSRRILSKMISKYCPSVEIVGKASSSEEALKVFNETQPNLLLLDVEMPYGSGFELLKKLPKAKFEVIFITGFDQYAIQAIKFHALDYLLKPIDITELVSAITKAEEAIVNKIDNQRIHRLLQNLDNKEQSTHQIAIPTLEGREFIPVEKIISCAADGIYTHFNLKNNEKLLSSQNLGEYEKLLPGSKDLTPHRFFRVHHSHLINLFYIKKINKRDNFVIMRDSSEIPIAQRRKSEFLSLIK